MYSREEKRQLIIDFWSQFDDYCSSLPELAWKKKKWILHRTGIKGVHLKFDPGRKSTIVMIEVNHRREADRLAMFEKLESYKVILEQNLDEGLIWDFLYARETGQEVCRIYTSLEGVDFHRKSDWSSIFAFMASKMAILEQNLMELKDVLTD
ncbi:MAG: DUF4268 domain-containing protein [Bacteroidota bacterium]|nr:DUF4268 domain-containing protein [Bacteroidota bacterium]